MERWILSGMKQGKVMPHFKAELLFSVMVLAHFQLSTHNTNDHLDILLSKCSNFSFAF